MIKRRLTGLILSFIILVSSSKNIFANSKYNKELIDGDTNQISITLNKKAFEKSDDIILVNEDSLIDAISATPLAYQLDAPIITTKWIKMDKETLKYIKELGSKRVIIIGGLKNVSKTVERNLENMGLEIQRIYGENRYDTSLMIAEEMKKIDKDVSKLLILNKRARIENSIALYSYAAKLNMPIVWSTDDDFKDIKKYIKKNNIEDIYAIGNSEKFTYEVTNSIKNVQMIKEINKSDTNTQMIKLLQRGDMKDIYTVNVEDDSIYNNTENISLGVVAAKENKPILITGESLSYSQEKFIKKNNIKNLIQVGLETKDYSIINTLVSKNFISASILIIFILLIIFRAFRYQS